MGIFSGSGRKDTGRTDKYSDESPKKDYQDYRSDVSPKKEAREIKEKSPTTHVGKKAEQYSDSIQAVLKGWDRNLDKIRKLIDAKLIELDEEKADEDIKTYWVKRILRQWGGPAALYKEFLPK